MFERENAFALEMKNAAELTGSEKQIAWAKDLVQKFAFVVTTSTFPSKRFEEAKEFTAWVVKNHTSAKWWINNRNEGYRFYDNLVMDWEEETEED